MRTGCAAGRRPGPVLSQLGSEFLFSELGGFLVIRCVAVAFCITGWWWERQRRRRGRVAYDSGGLIVMALCMRSAVYGVGGGERG